jgi:hypothetical protein
MAQKLYFTSQISDVTTAPTTRGAWDQDSSVIVPLRSTQQGTRTSNAGSETSTTNNYDILLLKGVSPPISAAVTIDGNLDYGLSAAESAAGANSTTHIHVWVMAPDGSNRGTLITDNIFGNEWATGTGTDSGSGESPAAIAMSSVSAQVGDRIVVEVGARNVNTSSSNFTMTMSYGGMGLSDITDGGSAANAAWVDFGEDISFDETFDFPQFRGSSLLSGGAFAAPTGLAAGDDMFVAIAQTGGTDIPTPTDWIEVFDAANSGRVAVFTKKATAGDITAGSFAFTTDGTVSGILVAFYDTDPTDGIAVESSNTTTSASRDITTTGFTPQANSVILMMYPRYKGGGDDPIGTDYSFQMATDDPSYTKIATQNGTFPSAGTIVAVGFAYRPQATATGTMTGTTGGGVGDSLKGLAAFALVRQNDSAFTPRVIFM